MGDPAGEERSAGQRKSEETGRSRSVPLGAGAFQSCFAQERRRCSRSAPLRARQGVENLTRAALKTAQNEFATLSVANPSFARGAVGWLQCRKGPRPTWLFSQKPAHRPGGPEDLG